MILKVGTFVRVKIDHTFRAGMDGLVVNEPDNDGYLGLIFGCDRYNEIQNCECVGVEMWHKDELDLPTAEY